MMGAEVAAEVTEVAEVAAEDAEVAAEAAKVAADLTEVTEMLAALLAEATGIMTEEDAGLESVSSSVKKENMFKIWPSTKLVLHELFQIVPLAESAEQETHQREV
jgi:hypothetical protein